MSSGRFRRSRGQFFPTKFDTERMQNDMMSMQEQFGVEVQWWYFDEADTAVNSIYDEPDSSTGKLFIGPIRVPVISAVRRMGPQEGGEEGLYTVDTLDVRASYEMVRRVGITPEIDLNTTNHLNDRLGYEGRYFDIQAITSDGQYDPTHTYLTLDIRAKELRPDELQYSPQFASEIEP